MNAQTKGKIGNVESHNFELLCFKGYHEESEKTTFKKKVLQFIYVVKTSNTHTHTHLSSQ